MYYILTLEESIEKRLSSRRGERLVFGIGPFFKSEKNNGVPSILAALLRSTNQRIKVGLTRGQDSACWPRACLQNSMDSNLSLN